MRRKVTSFICGIAATVAIAVTILSAPGLSLMRCSHTGRISFDEFEEERDCGMGDDNRCMEHFMFQITDAFNSSHFTGIPDFQPAPVPADISQLSSWSGPSLAESVIHLIPDSSKDPPDILLDKLVLLRI